MILEESLIAGLKTHECWVKCCARISCGSKLRDIEGTFIDGIDHRFEAFSE
jgi:hypothetical protein